MDNMRDNIVHSKYTVRVYAWFTKGRHIVDRLMHMYMYVHVHVYGHTYIHVVQQVVQLQAGVNLQCIV